MLRLAEISDANKVRELSVCGAYTLSESAVRRQRRDGPVSTFIFTTPFWTAVLMSSFVEPDPPWKTRNLKIQYRQMAYSANSLWQHIQRLLVRLADLFGHILLVIT